MAILGASIMLMIKSHERTIYGKSGQLRKLGESDLEQSYEQQEVKTQTCSLRLVVCNKSHLCVSERGVVWEETIILLPDNVHYVFLSATIPNARQFAEWICHLHKQVGCCTGIIIRDALLYCSSCM